MIDRRLHQVLLWTPRVLGFVGVIFLGLFALDVFGIDAGFWEKILGFLVHLIPATLLLVVVLLSWRWPGLGGLTFLSLGAFYVWGTNPHPWSWDVTIAGPMFLIGLLFLAGWLARSRRQVEE
jgi:hypothetical protein